MKRNDKTTTNWNDYELIDCGFFRKLERFGSIILDRPDPQAVWNKSFPEKWADAHAQFGLGKNEKWAMGRDISESWNVSVQSATIELSFGNFKHIGIFPEHAAQWELIASIAKKHPGMRMLNLFGYTGVASLIAALHGAQVTHVDASKQTIQTVKENIARSGLSPDAMRLVVEDALKYAKRLVSRGEQFEMIVMDPPAFGRGPKGEVWKIEEKLCELLSTVVQLISPDAKMVILNGYAAGFSAQSFGQVMNDMFKGKGGEVSYGDTVIAQSNSDRVLPTGIYAQWQK